MRVLLKVAFFRKSLNLQKNIYSKKLSWNLIFKILAHNSIMLWAGMLDFKFRIVFWNTFFWRFGDLKNESHFLKKSHLEVYPLSFITCQKVGKTNLKCSTWSANHIRKTWRSNLAWGWIFHLSSLLSGLCLSLSELKVASLNWLSLVEKTET